MNTMTTTGTAADPFRNHRIGVEGSSMVNGRDWGVDGIAALETAGALVGEQLARQSGVSAIANACHRSPRPRTGRGRRHRPTPPTASGPASQPSGATMSLSPVRLNHAVLYVADLRRSVDFYTRTFSMEVVATEPRADAAFLRLPRSGNHHDLGLFGVGTDGGPKRRGGIGLYHLAWQVDTIDELAEARQVLRKQGASVGESSHGATKSLYGADPDGHEFEIMWMLPREDWGRYEHAAPIDHLDLDAEVAQWSGVRTAGRIEQEPAGRTGGRS